MTSIVITVSQEATLERLVRLARGDTVQSRTVANFLLAWWNAEECGGFDLTGLRQLDTLIAADLFTLFSMIAERRIYPDTLGYGQEFEQIVASWRPMIKRR